MLSFQKPTTVSSRYQPPTPPSESLGDTAKMSDSVAARANGVASRWRHKHIWIITGPAGCGKTSVAEYLHNAFDIPYLEGDTFHTPENIAKMAAGQPLTDADRWDWLILLREQSLLTLTQPNTPGVIVTCSALKRKYRDVMRIAAYHHPDVKVHFVFLSATESLLMDRVRLRKDHYMKDYMVRSQFQSLETPAKDEADMLSVDASGDSKEVQELALGVVNEVMAEDADEL